MTIQRRKILSTTAGILGACALGVSTLASAAGYPEKPVTIYVGFSAGGPTDIVARVLAEKLTQKFGQSFIIDNRVGASGAVAANQVKKANPDGYTLMMGAASTNAINPSLHKNLKFNGLRDFTPITNVASLPNVLVVGPQVQARNIKDFIQAARTEKYSFASSGAGGSTTWWC